MSLKDGGALRYITFYLADDFIQLSDLKSGINHKHSNSEQLEKSRCIRIQIRHTIVSAGALFHVGQTS